MADLAKRTVGTGGKLQVSRGRNRESGCRRTRIAPNEVQQTSRTCVPGTGYVVSFNRMLRRHVPMNGTLDAARVCRRRLIKLCLSGHTCRVYRTRDPRAGCRANHVSLSARGVKLPRRRGQPRERWTLTVRRLQCYRIRARSIKLGFEPFSHDG